MDDSISTSLQIRKEAKKAKSKKNTTTNKPIKVVYISNPMKVKTSASKFRALVQKLTGQDAEFPNPTDFTDTEDAIDGDGDGGNQMVPDASKNSGDDNEHEQQPEPSHNHTIGDDQGVFDDEVFTQLMLENFGILPQGLLI